MTRKPGVTSSQVTKHAGVSQSAVSRTFTPGASISAKTRARVVAAANQLGYPDAIFVANNHMAIAVTDVSRHELGLLIPDDLSIVGYDDVGAAAWQSYAITSVATCYRRTL